MKHEPSKLAQAVVDAFQRSATAAVQAHLSRGEPVVGEVKGVWMLVQKHPPKNVG